MILGLLFFIIALVVVVIVTINLWLPAAAKWFVEKKSNFPTEIKKSNISLTKGIIDIEGISLKNPKGKFEQEKFVTLNKVYGQVEYKTLFEKQIVIPEITIDLENFTCEKNKEGDINAMVLVNSFTGGDSDEKKEDENKKEEEPKKEEEEKKEEAEGEGEKKEGEEEGKTFIIHKLNVRIGSIELYNLTHEDGEHKINLNKTLSFEEVTMEKKKEIITQILQDPDLQNAGYSVVLGTALGQGSKIVSDALKKVSDKVNEFIPQETVNQIKDAIPDDVKQAATESLKEAAKQIKVSDDVKKAASSIANSIPDDYKKAASAGLKKLFG